MKKEIGRRQPAFIIILKLMVLAMILVSNSISYYGVEEYIYEGLAAIPSLLVVKPLLDGVALPLCFFVAGFGFWEDYKWGVFRKTVWLKKAKTLLLPFFVIGLLWLIPIRFQFYYPIYEWNDWWWAVKNMILGWDPGHLWILLVLFLDFAVIGLIIEVRKRVPIFPIIKDLVVLALFVTAGKLAEGISQPLVQNCCFYLKWIYVGYVFRDYSLPGKLETWKRMPLKNQVLSRVTEHGYAVFLLHLPLTYITLNYGVRWNPWLFMAINLFVWGGFCWMAAKTMEDKSLIRQLEILFFLLNMLLLARMSVNLIGYQREELLWWLVAAVLIESLLIWKWIPDVNALLLVVGMYAHCRVVYAGEVFLYQATFLPLLFYLFGKMFVAYEKTLGKAARARVVIQVLAVFLCVEGILNAKVWYELWGEGFRYWKTYWVDQLLPATQHVVWCVPIIAMVFYGGCCLGKKRVIGIGFVVAGLWMVYFSWITKSRAAVMIFGLVLGVNIVLFFWMNRKKKQIRRLFWCLLGVIPVFAILLTVAYTSNMYGVQDLFASVEWSRGGGILNNVRFRAQRLVLSQLFLYPHGGRQMDLAGLNYAHNVWLDMANASGLLPFTLIVLYTILTIKDMVLLIGRNTIPQENKYLLVSVYSAFLLYYFVEPALDANIMYWAIGCLVAGVIRGSLVGTKPSVRWLPGKKRKARRKARRK